MIILIIIFIATFIITFCRKWDKLGTIRANFDLMVTCLIVVLSGCRRSVDLKM